MILQFNLVRYPILFSISLVLVHIIQTTWIVPSPYLNSPSQSLFKLITSEIYSGENLRIISSKNVESYSAVNDAVARDLFLKVRVLCWVMTGPKNHWRKARHVKRTWGKRCNILLFMSSEEDKRIPTIKLPSVEGYDSLWSKTREAFRYVWENYRDQADWFLKADDDSFMILENLRYHLSTYNTSEPLHFGHKYKAYIISGYMQGGSGYVLSKEALRRFVEVGLKEGKKCATDETGWAEDVKIGECMQELDCKGIDTRDSYGRDRYLPLTLEAHTSLGIADDTWFFDVHPSYYHIQEGFNCCSDTAIGFHQVTPEQMYLYEYLIYTLNPYGIESIRAELQSKPGNAADHDLKATPFPGLSPEEVKWAASLKSREEAKRNEAQMMEEKAKILDDNETVRKEAWKKKELINS